jgi:branched-chain amino acid transport system ATP-binding protein
MEAAVMPTEGAPPVGPPEPGTLRTSRLTVQFGGVLALSEVDLEVQPGQILGLIGPNGAGKTTLLNAATGFQRPTSGRVLLGDVEISSWSPARIARLGVVRSFQSIRLFAGLSVLENVRVAAIGRGQRMRRAAELAWESLAIVGLEKRAYWRAGTLPHGEQRQLGLARALCVAPRFLLLDEPAAGLDDADRSTLVSVIKASRDRLGCGVVVIEHDVRFISSLCDRVQVLDYGRTISLGTPDEIRADPLVKAAYLGTARV